MISNRTIEEVKERANLLEIAGEFVKLKRRGTNYVGVCPFHSEKTGSFHIRDNGHFYHCFGCGVSGNAISFVMEARGLSFPDAVEELAARFGVRVEYDGRTKEGPRQPDREKFYKINQIAFEFFQREFNTAPAGVKSYLTERGLKEPAIREFGVGFAANDRAKLLAFLRSRGAPDELIVGSGLARRNKRGELYDTFRARIVFPIFVERRRIAGFGGRILPALVPADFLAAAPKYLNSPESPVYEKNKILFGLPHALESVRRSRELYLVEGYMDVIGLWQAGVRNVAATCGTAVTENHVRRLAHLVQRVTLLFDGDQAGRNAAGKSYSVFVNSGIDCTALFLPDGEDPDTIALKHGAETEKFLGQLRRTPLFECYLEFMLRKHGALDAKDLGAAAKGKLAEEIAELLKRVTNRIERAELIERTALKLQIEARAFHQLVEGEAAVRKSTEPELKRTASQSAASLERAAASAEKPVAGKLPRLDHDLLVATMLKRGDLPKTILHDSTLCEVLQPVTRTFIGRLSEIFSRPVEQQKQLVQRLLNAYGESWIDLWKRAHEMRMAGDLNVDALYDGCRRSAARVLFNQQIKVLEHELQTTTDAPEREEIALRLIELRRRALQPGTPG